MPSTENLVGWFLVGMVIGFVLVTWLIRRRGGLKRWRS